MKVCLIVDDSGIVRKLARHMVEKLGFECHEAEDGRQALDACRAMMPSIILLDWNMPVMNGLDFLKALRQSPGGSSPQVIFCTTESDVGRIAEGLDAGADEYIMKPFDGGILRGKFEQIGAL
jgi:two-component system chemotaxis response regulator CheY